MKVGKYITVHYKKVGRLWRWQIMSHETEIGKGLSPSKKQARADAKAELKIKAAEYRTNWQSSTPLRARADVFIRGTVRRCDR